MIIPLTTFWRVAAGRGYIAGEDSGIVSINGAPASRRVVVFTQNPLQHVRSTWSDASGHYRIEHLDPNRKYLILAIDHKGQYDPVAYDQIVPYV